MNMNLKQVTITGADDSIDPRILVDLSVEFPFAEWGILASLSNSGSNRYPTKIWLHTLSAIHELNESLHISLHIQGRYLREMFYHDRPQVADLDIWSRVRRVQLNFHGEPVPLEENLVKTFIRNLSSLGKGKQYIFQMDGVNDDFYLEHIWGGDYFLDEPDAYPLSAPLFDRSAGAGVLPDSWPRAELLEAIPGPDGEGVEVKAYHGYAGGLGPDNLAEQLPLIAAAADGAPYWVDMETRVRSENDSKFDLAKVRHCLEIAAPFVASEALA